MKMSHLRTQLIAKGLVKPDPDAKQKSMARAIASRRRDVCIFPSVTIKGKPVTA